MSAQQQNLHAEDESSFQDSPKQRSRFTFQNAWFEQIIPTWVDQTSSLLPPAPPVPLRILELGSFEGASTTWILDNLANHPSTSMTAIDTFAGGMEHDNAEVESLQSRFLTNVGKCSNVGKLRVMKNRTEDGLIDLRKEGAKFDFIYIDASHVAIDVLHDAVLSWQMLELGGRLVFDDWTWKGYNEDVLNPRMAIMAFLQCAAAEAEVVETESQIWITRVKSRIVATKNPDPALMYWDNSQRFEVDPSSIKNNVQEASDATESSKGRD
ncbi:SAM-dependent methyltransferase [Calycina marina]|uniref:SAM-dependent methyltransferase n=1 Tax=Calycina marina TaxID=1763456 RepID=A0A9P8CDI7_9HELO|nr:SAM-dependent methyltransferase [Calycina marina]